MEATDESAEAASQRDATGEPVPEECPEISAYSTTETRTVFTEADNGDGWIATDLTVEIRE